jgi:hypothetical protein
MGSWLYSLIRRAALAPMPPSASRDQFMARGSESAGRLTDGLRCTL